MTYNGSDKHKQALFENKQDKLTAGDNITLTPQQDGTVRIDASGGGGGGDVTDVQVDGQSVVDEHGVAQITMPSVPSDIDDLDDVDASSPSNGDVLKYNSNTGKWENGEAGGGNVDDVVMNGQSIVDGNKVASFNNYVELTQSQYDALPASKLTDGVLYCIKDSGSVEGEQFAPVIYSLAEREVGVWTNGKPLYQRTVTFTVDSTSGYKRVTTDIANAETVLIDFSASYHLGGGLTKLPCVGYLGSGADVSYLNSSLALLGTVVDNYLCIDYRAGQNVFGASAVVTVRYTKTTDVPGSGQWGTNGVPMVHYDGNEKIIGTWFGETLYEKIIPFDNTGQSSLNIDVSSLNIGICPYVMPLLNSSAANTMTYYQSSSDYINAYYYKSSQEVVIRGGNPYGQGTGFVTIRYTKSS